MARSWVTSKLSGGWEKTENMLQRVKDRAYTTPLPQIARAGVDKLRAVTPKLSGSTAEAWLSEIVENARSIDINMINTKVHDGFYVVRGLVEGHFTGTGGWVQGQNFVDPASLEMIKEMADSIWREVTGS